MVFRKNLRSLERRWEKISKFLGDLPSEQIFYRNIPLGAPEYGVIMVHNESSKTYIAKTRFFLQVTEAKKEAFVRVGRYSFQTSKLKRYMCLKVSVGVHIWRETIKHIC